jgi:hypothetical protein
VNKQFDASVHLHKSTLSKIERDPNEQKASLSLFDFIQLFKDNELRRNMLVICGLATATNLFATSYIFHVSLFRGDPALKFIVYG